jgi:hypothetical protein
VTKCRCGHDLESAEPHPCHECQAPSRDRYYARDVPTFRGTQMKISTVKTYACDACWAKFKEARNA